MKSNHATDSRFAIQITTTRGKLRMANGCHRLAAARASTHNRDASCVDGKAWTPTEKPTQMRNIDSGSISCRTCACSIAGKQSKTHNTELTRNGATETKKTVRKLIGRL